MEEQAAPAAGADAHDELEHHELQHAFDDELEHQLLQHYVGEDELEHQEPQHAHVDDELEHHELQHLFDDELDHLELQHLFDDDLPPEGQQPPCAAQRAELSSDKRTDVLAVPTSFAAAFPHLAQSMLAECPNMAELMAPKKPPERPDIDALVEAVAAKEEELEEKEQEAERRKNLTAKEQEEEGEKEQDKLPGRQQKIGSTQAVALSAAANWGTPQELEDEVERLRKQRAEELDSLKITLEIGLRTGGEHQQLPDPDTDFSAPPTEAIFAFLQPGDSGSALHAVLQVLLRMPHFVREVRKAARRRKPAKLVDDLEKLQRAARLAAQTQDKEASAKQAAAARERFKAIQKDLEAAAAAEGEEPPADAPAESRLWEPVECFRRIMAALAPTTAVQDPFTGTLARTGGNCARCQQSGQVVPSTTTHLRLELQSEEGADRGAGRNNVSNLLESFFSCGGAGPAAADCDDCMQKGRGSSRMSLSAAVTVSRWPLWLLADLRGPASFLPGAAAASVAGQVPESAFAETHLRLAAHTGAGAGEQEQGRYRLRGVLMPAAPRPRCSGEEAEEEGREEPRFEVHWYSPALAKWCVIRDSACVALETPPLAPSGGSSGGISQHSGEGFAGIRPEAICFYQYRETSEPPAQPNRGGFKPRVNAGAAGSAWGAFSGVLAMRGLRGGPQARGRAKPAAHAGTAAKDAAKPEEKPEEAAKPPAPPKELLRLIRSREHEPWRAYVHASRELYASDEHVPGDHVPAEGYGARAFDGGGCSIGGARPPGRPRISIEAQNEGRRAAQNEEEARPAPSPQIAASAPKFLSSEDEGPGPGLHRMPAQPSSEEEPDQAEDRRRNAEQDAADAKRRYPETANDAPERNAKRRRPEPASEAPKESAWSSCKATAGEGAERDGHEEEEEESSGSRRTSSTSSSEAGGGAREQTQADERELLRTVEAQARVMGKGLFPVDEKWLRPKFAERPLKDVTKAWVACLWTYLIASTPDPLPQG